MISTLREQPWRRAIGFATAVLAFLAFAAWAVASPVGASPDDDFHLPSIWCGLDYRDGLCEPADDPSMRVVQRDLVIESVCFAFNPETSAQCQGEDFGNSLGERIATPRGNFTGLYPPVFYATMGVLATNDINASVIAMRLTNAALFVSLASITYLLLPGRFQRALVGGLFVVAVPLGMFVVPSTNPSSWAMLSAAILWISLVGFFETSGKRKLALGIIATLATVIGAGARADAALYGVAAIMLATFLSARSDRVFWRSSVLPLVLSAVAVSFFLGSSQSEVVEEGLGGASPQGAGPWLGLFALNALNAPQLWADALGAGNLGWLDTPLPSVIGVALLSGFAAMIVIQLDTLPRRALVALATVFAILILLPAYVLTQSGATVGAQVQPRYLLPILVIAAGVALVGTPSVARMNPLTLTLGGAALVLSNSLALFVNIHRYVAGLEPLGANLDSMIEWWWREFPLTPMTVWLLGSFAFAGAVALVLQLMRHDSVLPSASATDDGLNGKDRPSLLGWMQAPKGSSPEENHGPMGG